MAQPQLWYMSFTFTQNPPGFATTIYLAFFSSYTESSGLNTVTNWYNIKPDNACLINTSSEITAEIRGGFSGTYTNIGVQVPGVLFTVVPKLVSTYDIPVDGIPYGTIQINSYDNNLEYSLNGLTYDIYAGTYIFSLGAPLPCCFNEGTKILCYTQLENSLICILKEEYRLVQHLKIGDLVKSYLHGYRKVSKLLKGSFVNNPNEDGVANCMYRMIKTENNGLIEDLTLTRNHGVLVEKLTEDEEKKVDKNNLPVIDGLLSIITADSDKFEKVMDTNVYKYYHFSLDGDGDNDRRFGVYANGLLVETPSNNMMDGAMNIKPLDF